MDWLSLSILPSKVATVARAFQWASLALARSLSVEVPFLSFLEVLLLGGWWFARPGSSKPRSGLPSFCLRQSFREDTTLAVNSSICSGPQGGDPGNLLSFYTWYNKSLNSSLLVWIIHSASFCPCSTACRNIPWRMMEWWGLPAAHLTHPSKNMLTSIWHSTSLMDWPSAFACSLVARVLFHLSPCHSSSNLW